MAERAAREPTPEEIVVALRETRREAVRAPLVVDAAELRDGEIARLLADNARLNERVMFLLKVIGHDAGPARVEPDRGTIYGELKAALEAELRPVLLVLLRLLEKRGPDASGRPEAPADWIADLIGRLDREAAATPGALPPRPKLFGRMARAFKALRL
jgi:hypothetical protein